MQEFFIFVWVIVMIAVFIVSALVKRWLDKKVRLERTTKPAFDDAEIESMFDRKQGDISYSGCGHAYLMDDQTKAQRLVKLRVRFTLVRNIAAMTHREREMLRFYLLMVNRGWIPDDASCRIHFGLVYGDGKAAIGNYWYRIPAAAMRRFGVNNQADAIRWYARELGVTTESAISELMTIFDGIRQTHPGDPLVHRIAAVIASGNRWFTQGDLPGSAFEASGKQHGLFLGLLSPDHKPIAWYGEGSLVTVAPPGAGKTQGHVIPNLLLWHGPAVVLDVKGELWATTSAWRQKHVGPVYRFAPFEPRRSHRYNPLSAIRSDPQFLWEDAALAAGMAVVPQGSKEPFFEQSAQRVLTVVNAEICRWSARPQDRAMSRVLDIASGVGWEDFLTRAMLDVSFPPLARAATAFHQMDERTRSNVLSTLQTSLKSWEGERIAAVTQQSDWSPLDLRNGSNPTVYICVNPEEIEAALSILRVVIGQHVRALTRTLPGPDDPDVLFLLDEFPQLRHMPPVEEGIAVGRGYGLKFWLFAQSLGQIRTVYKQADSLLGQCGLRAFVNPSLQDGTAQKIADDLGYFDSVLDGTRQRVVEPQALGGPAFRGQQIVFTGAAKPLRLDMIHAHGAQTLSERFGEADISFSRSRP
jgi:type IV secretion system protein VirD4